MPPETPDDLPREGDAASGPADAFVVANEFAAVEVAIVRSSNGARLVVRDLRSGREQGLDAVMLETLVWLPDHLLEALSAPAVTRWDAVEAVKRIVDVPTTNAAPDDPAPDDPAPDDRASDERG